MDFMAWYGEWQGCSVICISIAANDAQDLWLKRAAFNAMIEAQGYGLDTLRTRPRMRTTKK